MINVYSRDKHLILAGLDDLSDHQTAMQLPANKKWRGKELQFIPSIAAVTYIAENWDDIEWKEGLAEDFYSVYIYNEKLRTMHKDFIKNPIYGDHVFETVPYDHQLDVFQMSKDFMDFALFMEQGTGKSHVAINTAAWLYNKNEIDAMVIIAPKGVHAQWLNEQIPLHMPDNVEWAPALWVSNMQKACGQMFKTVDEYSGLKIYSFNIDAVNTEGGYARLKKCLKENKCLLICDESSRIKTPNAKRTKRLIKISQMADYRRILTGTPITSGIENLYSQFKFLSPWILGHNAYQYFKDEYMIFGGFENREIIGYKNTEKLLDKVAPFSYRVTKKECLDLPDKIYAQRQFELNAIERSAYDDMKYDMYTVIEDEDVTATIVLTQMLRLQQIASGINPATGIMFGNPSRLHALQQELDEIDAQVVLWSRFVPELDALERLLAGAGVRYGGTDKARSDALSGFQNGKYKYLIANPQSAGLGLNLAHCSNNIYVSNSFSLEHRLQSEDRTHRIGTVNHVRYVDLIAINTIDKHIHETLASRKNIADITLRELQEWLL